MHFNIYEVSVLVDVWRRILEGGKGGGGGSDRVS